MLTVLSRVIELQTSLWHLRVNFENAPQLKIINSAHDCQQSHADQQMFLYFDEHGPYQGYPESQSCRSQPVTTLGQSMNPHVEVSDEETKLQRQEETWKVASEDLQHDRTSQAC